MFLNNSNCSSTIDEIFKQFNGVFNDMQWSSGATANLCKNVSYDENGATIKLVVPGYGKEDIKVKTSNDQITIVCNTEDVDRDVTKFSRTYKCSPEFDVKAVTGKLQNGVLKLKVPKVKSKPIKETIVSLD